MEAIKYSDEGLSIIDQLLLPQKLEYVPINNCRDAWNAIHDMQVRGAPAIAIVGGLSLAIELRNSTFDSCEQLSSFIVDKMDYLTSARPTATNIFSLRKKLLAMLNKETIQGLTPEALRFKIICAIENYKAEDLTCNKNIGLHGLSALMKLCPGKINILTHCNTGALATSGYGTALGVVRKVYESNLLDCCYFTETRPYNQGSRLTAFELKYEDIPSILVCDSMVASLMQKKQISAVITGADCVAANGDTANKIGTYQIAVLARYHNIPFFVAAPRSSINLGLACGDSIVIEERPSQEITSICGIKISVEGVKCWNPSFDVTPNHLITGIITEHGVFDTSTLKEMIQLIPD